MKRKLSPVSAGIAVTLAMPGSMLMSSANAHAAETAADCLEAHNVWVVVQDYDREPAGGCATSFATGYEAMVSAGFDVNGEGFVCQIDGAPETCSLDEAWWSYWHLAPTTGGWDNWEFSELGLSSYQPQPGTVEGWRLLPWERDPAPPTFSAPDLDAGDAVAPIVLSAPSDTSVEAQSDATFTATVTGVPRPTLQWEQSSVAGQWSAIEGATAGTLMLSSVTEKDDGLLLRLVATNTSGTVTTPAVALTVRPFSGVAGIPDGNFRTCLNEALGQSADAATTVDQLGTLTDVSCFFKGITDLTGAEHLTSMTSFDLTFNDVTDVSPLANLGALTMLNLDSNKVRSLAPLAGLTGLTNLDLDKNDLVSMEGIEFLTGLTDLSVGGNSLTGLPALGALTDLTKLDVSSNPLTSLEGAATLDGIDTLLAYKTAITDIAATASMTSLKELNIHTTAVTDLSPLSGSDLTELNASSTQVSDLSPLADSKIEKLNIRRTGVTSLAPLRDATFLTELRAQELGLTTVDPLAGLPLTKLYVHDNALTDLSPLQDTELTSWGALTQEVRVDATVGEPVTLPTVRDRDAGVVTLKDAPESGVVTFAEAGTATYSFSDAGKKFTGRIIVTIVDAPEPDPTPTVDPSASPTIEPTAEPTSQPTAEPTSQPPLAQTQSPTALPTHSSEAAPTQSTTPNGTGTPAPPQSGRPIGLPNTGH